MPFNAEPDYLRQTRVCESGPAPIWRGHRADAPAGAPTIHFLSGNGFCGGTYWPLLRQFLPDYGLFCNDIEGHGASDAPLSFSGIEPVLQRIRGIIAAQRLDQASLIGLGHSFGGALTLRLAADHPGLFKAIVLLDPIVIPTPAWLGVKLASALGRNPMAEGARRRRTRWSSREEAFERLHDRGIYAGWTDEALSCFLQHALRPAEDGNGVTLSCPTDLEAQIFENPIYAWRAFRRVQCPVLFLYGQSSYSFFPWAQRLAQRANPRVQAQSLPGEHCFMQQNPAASHAAIRDFLGRHAL